MERKNHHSRSAASANGKGRSGSGWPDNNDDVVAAVPNLSSPPAVVAATVAATMVEHAMEYLQYMEKTNAMLERGRQDLALVRQVVAEAKAASSSSAPPQSVHGRVVPAMSPAVPDACSVAPPQPLRPAPRMLPAAAMSSDVSPRPLQQQPVAAAEPAPPRSRIIATRVGFQTWTWPDLFLSVSNDKAYIKVRSPCHLGTQTRAMVLSLLNKHGIEVLTAQVDSDAVRHDFNILARVTIGGENSSALKVYQLAVAEILVWLNTD